MNEQTNAELSDQLETHRAMYKDYDQLAILCFIGHQVNLWTYLCLPGHSLKDSKVISLAASTSVDSV